MKLNPSPLSHLRWIPGTAGFMLVLSISIHRMWTIHFSIARIILPKHARIMGWCSWLCGLAPPACAFFYKPAACFNQVIATCQSDFYDNEEAKHLIFLLVATLVFIPMILIIILNCGMVFTAMGHAKRRAATSASTRALTTVTCVCGLFIVSVCPYVLVVIVKATGKTIPISYEILQAYIFLLNASGNPILYTLTNRRFKSFLLTKICATKNLCEYINFRKAFTDNEDMTLSHMINPQNTNASKRKNSDSAESNVDNVENNTLPAKSYKLKLSYRYMESLV